MNKRCKKYLNRIVGILLISSLSAAFADVEQDRAEGIAWLLKHQNGDGSWGEQGAKVAATAEALAALRNSGADSGFLYSRALSWLANVRAVSNDSLARKITALSAAGFDVNELGLVDDLLSRRNEQLGWGAFEGHRSGFPDTSLALMAINDAGVDYADLTYGLYLIWVAQDDGDSGWSYMAGSQGVGQKQQIMPSAYNLMALSAFQSEESSTIYIQSGVNWLVNTTLQSDGSFLEDSSITTGSVHKTALGYLAIKASMDAEAVTDMETVLSNAQTYILAQQADDGGWEDDPLSTALALRTLPSTTMSDTDGDGIPDTVETLLGTDSSTADGRDLLAGNGLDPDNLQDSGMTASSIIQEVLVDSSFASTPSLTGGISPYEWQLSSGGLPTGVSLSSSANGTLSGTPTTPGVSSFALLVQDADANNLVVPGFIRVLALDDYITDTDMDGAPSVFEINKGYDPTDSNSTPVIDSDGDLIVDWYDQFPEDSSEWADNDSDGIGNNADQDDDNDGMPDSYEIQYGLNPYDDSDADIDSDGDNLTNLEEYSYDTDPLNVDTDNDGFHDDVEIASGNNPNFDEGLLPVIVTIITTFLVD
jgi:hypothetical protein